MKQLKFFKDAKVKIYWLRFNL